MADNISLLARLEHVHNVLRLARGQIFQGRYVDARELLGKTTAQHIKLRPHEDHLLVGTRVPLAERVEAAQDADSKATLDLMNGCIEEAIETIQRELP